MSKYRVTHKVPERLDFPYPVIGPDGVGRLKLHKLLDADFADPDAWLLIDRTFRLGDYLPDALVHRVTAESGARYYELDAARRICPDWAGLCDRSRSNSARPRRKQVRSEGLPQPG